jgi:hypothetical protein
MPQEPAMIRVNWLFLTLLLAHCAVFPVAAQTPEAFTCPMTLPGESRPPARMDPFGPEESVHYADSIWQSIPNDGMLALGPEAEIGFGTLQGWRTTTVTWMRADGVEGWVIVSGERLDAKSDLSPRTPLSPQRQYVQRGYVLTGIAFPSEGCWRLTGTVGEHEISWVVDVGFVDEVVTPIT